MILIQISTRETRSSRLYVLVVVLFLKVFSVPFSLGQLLAFWRLAVDFTLLLAFRRWLHLALGSG